MVKPLVKLDYDASVPVDTRAPFFVKADPDKPPGERFVDFKPKEVHKTTTKPNRDGMYQRKPTLRRTDTDFLSGDDSARRREKDKLAIIELAKELYKNEAGKRAAHEAAQKLVDKVTAEEKKQPSVELAKALKILECRPPMTKEDAIENATKHYYGQLM